MCIKILAAKISDSQLAKYIKRIIYRRKAERQLRRMKRESYSPWTEEEGEFSRLRLEEFKVSEELLGKPFDDLKLTTWRGT